MTPLAFVLIALALFAGIAIGWIGRGRSEQARRDWMPPFVESSAERRKRWDRQKDTVRMFGEDIQCRDFEAIRKHLRDELDSGEAYGRGRDDA